MTCYETYPSLDGVRICAALRDAGPDAKASVVLAHGITVDKDESADAQGIPAFVELSDALAEAGYNVLRFDFRGHGGSGLSSRDMTIAGELLDLTASIRQAKARWGLPLALLGASFGAVSSVLYTANAPGDVDCLVLWNPVLDLRRTFIQPLMPKPRRFFNAAGYAHLQNHGYLLLEGFQVGRCLVEEMRRIEPFDAMRLIECPVLTLHGENDSYVPFETSEAYAVCNADSAFVPVVGAEHGFMERDARRFVIRQTVDWLDKHLGERRLRAGQTAQLQG